MTTNMIGVSQPMATNQCMASVSLTKTWMKLYFLKEVYNWNSIKLPQLVRDEDAVPHRTSKNNWRERGIRASNEDQHTISDWRMKYDALKLGSGKIIENIFLMKIDCLHQKGRHRSVPFTINTLNLSLMLNVEPYIKDTVGTCDIQCFLNWW